MKICNGINAVMLLVVFLFTGSAQANQTLTLRIDGFSSDKGFARIVMFDSRASYEGTKPPYRIVSVPIIDGHVIWSTSELPKGEYALIPHHDENANDDLDRPYFSLPLERYGYSNRAWKTMGLPDYDEVSFIVGNASVEQHITVKFNPIASGILSLRPYANLIAFAVVLIVPLLTIGVWRRILPKADIDAKFLGRLGLVFLLFVMGSEHFTNAGRMILVLPEWMPGRLYVVYAIGVLEIVLALAMLVRQWFRGAGLMVVFTLIALFPVNLPASVNASWAEGLENDGAYLFVKISFQLFLIGWTVWASNIWGFGRRRNSIGHG